MSCWHKRISVNRGMSGFVDRCRTWEVSAAVVVNRVVADRCQSLVVIGSCARFAHFRLVSTRFSPHFTWFELTLLTLATYLLYLQPLEVSGRL